MRFAMAAADRYQGVFKAFIEAGWQPVKLFTRPSKAGHDSHQAVAALAEQHHIPVQISRITADDLKNLSGECDVLVVASYDWRIPDWQPFVKYAVNFHNSPLPIGRGPYPVVRAILENYPAWGVTCHQLTSEMDQGAILSREDFPMQPDECHESLDLKIQIAAARLAFRTAKNFVELWNNAQPQSEGSYWPSWTDADRTMDFNLPVDQIMRQVRAFGAFGTLARINDMTLNVKRAVGWKEAHSIAPGQPVHLHDTRVVVTAADGYIGLLEWASQPPDEGAIKPA